MVCSSPQRNQQHGKKFSEPHPAALSQQLMKQNQTHLSWSILPSTTPALAAQGSHGSPVLPVHCKVPPPRRHHPLSWCTSFSLIHNWTWELFIYCCSSTNEASCFSKHWCVTCKLFSLRYFKRPGKARQVSSLPLLVWPVLLPSHQSPSGAAAVGSPSFCVSLGNPYISVNTFGSLLSGSPAP